MFTFFSLTAVNLVLGLGVVIFVYIMAQRVIQKVTGLYEFVLKAENDRKRIRRSGIVARVLRQLNKEMTFGDNLVDIMNDGYDYELTRVFLRGVDVSLVVDDTRDSSERGQLRALIQGYPTIKSCTDDLKYFVREIVRTVERENDRRKYQAITNPADDPKVSLAEIGVPEAPCS